MEGIARVHAGFFRTGLECRARIQILSMLLEKNVRPSEGGRDCILPEFLPSCRRKKCVAIGRALSQSS